MNQALLMHNSNFSHLLAVGNIAIDHKAFQAFLAK